MLASCEIHVLAKYLTDKEILDWGEATIHRGVRLCDVYRKARPTAEYVWIIEEAYLPDKSALERLIDQNRKAIVPMMTKSNSMWSNFWGDINQDGYYKESEDYGSVVSRDTLGVFNMPYVRGNILFRSDALPEVEDDDDDFEFSRKICAALRRKRVLMWVDNTADYGIIKKFDRLVLGDTIWELRDILTDFMRNILTKYENGESISREALSEIGSDVWRIPFFTERFCDAVVTECERIGKWSAGGDSHYDARIGSQENYPTQDIHLPDIGMHKFWSSVVIKRCCAAIMDILYNYKAGKHNIAFVAKYSASGQIKLDPHHDSSAYTTNIALSTPNIDYKGGGCRFIYKGLTVINTPKGHMILHPGKISHYHEGIAITEGTRYILVSFNE